MDAKIVFEKVKNSATIIAQKTSKAAEDVADAAGKKTNEIIGTTKLNFKIFDLNNEIEILYKEIGKIVYDVHSGIEISGEVIEQKFELIDEKNIKIEEYRQQISQYKPEVSVCPICGKELAPDAKFCGNCGSQV